MLYRPIPGTLVIGFGYRARQGKDLAARLIVERAGVDAHVFAFSDPIAAYCRVACGMTTRNPTLLQNVGWTARQGHPSVWIDAVYGAIQDRAPRVALVSGVRFPDEAAMIRDAGGKVVHIRRWNEDGTPFVSGDRNPEHPTEHGLDGFVFDYVIDNVSGRVEEFAAGVLNVYRWIREGS